MDQGQTLDLKFDDNGGFIIWLLLDGCSIAWLIKEKKIRMKNRV